MVKKISGDYTDDARLARRWKRRRIVNEQSTQDICDRIAMKNARRDVCEIADKDYQNFVNNLLVSVGDSSGDVDAKYVDNGHQNDDSEVSQPLLDKNVVDPDYKMFLQHLKPDGKSYVLNISVNDQVMFIKYEEEHHSDGLHSSLKKDQKRENTGTTGIAKSASGKERVETAEKLGKVFDNKKNLSVEINACSKGMKEKILSGNPAIESRVPVLVKELSVDCAESISHRQNGKPFEITGTSFSRSIDRPCESDSTSDAADEDYKTFLTGLVYEDDFRLVYTPVVGRSLMYEEDVESTSDYSPVMNIDPCKTSCTPFPRKSLNTNMSLVGGKCLLPPGTCSHSNYRERLMQDLQRPYDSVEFNSLFQEAKTRRARLRHREFRNGVSKSYPLGPLDKSYLDLYGDLALKIKLVERDRFRTLNLLRGLFFWLTNLSHEDAFQPWKDPSCLDVLPQA